jgi:hypothetical protein
MNKRIIFVSLIIIIITTIFLIIKPANGVYYRFNQHGYNNRENIEVLLLSNLNVNKVLLLNSSKKILRTLKAKLIGNRGKFNIYQVNLLKLTKGNYYLKDESSSTVSKVIEVNKTDNSKIIKATKNFFLIQRCGSQKNLLHKTCHINSIKTDTTKQSSLNLSGGWHDAGDYLRFMITTSYSSLLMLNAIQWNSKHQFADVILEEALWGMKWMKKMWNKDKGFLFQIGDSSDHKRWRLPDSKEEPLFSQKAYQSKKGSGANIAGRTIASFALASTLTKHHPSLENYSIELLQFAETVYRWSKENLNEAQSSTDNFYNEKSWHDDMAMASLELYKATGKKLYLKDSLKYIKYLDEGWGFDYARINALVFYKLGLYVKSKKKYSANKLNRLLNYFNNNGKQNIFKRSIKENYWGGNVSIMGSAISALFYKKLTGKDHYSQLAFDQWDYLLGKNPWGISFVSSIGHRWLKTPHHQISNLLKVDLPGYWAPGATKKKSWSKYNIKLSKNDSLSEFQDMSGVLFDDFKDYVTNEPTISASSTGLLLSVMMD